MLPKALVAVLAVAAGPLSAQARGPESPAGLRARMRAFVEAVAEGNDTVTASFFPARGDWIWVRTTHRPSSEQVGTWRFPGAQTLPAMANCDALYWSFLYNPHAQPLGSLRFWMENQDARWRYTGAGRFVPPSSFRRIQPDLFPDSTVFVEWRREKGRWVVSAFGDDGFADDPAPRDTVPEPKVDPATPPAEGAAYAAGLPWYEQHMPVRLRGHLYTKYGNPRPLERSELEPLGWFERVQVFVEKGQASRPSVIYLQPAPGVYQPYQTYDINDCPD